MTFYYDPLCASYIKCISFTYPDEFEILYYYEGRQYSLKKNGNQITLAIPNQAGTCAESPVLSTARQSALAALVQRECNRLTYSEEYGGSIWGSWGGERYTPMETGGLWDTMLFNLGLNTKILEDAVMKAMREAVEAEEQDAPSQELLDFINGLSEQDI